MNTNRCQNCKPFSSPKSKTETNYPNIRTAVIKNQIHIVFYIYLPPPPKKNQKIKFSLCKHDFMKRDACFYFVYAILVIWILSNRMRQGAFSWLYQVTRSVVGDHQILRYIWRCLRSIEQTDSQLINDPSYPRTLSSYQRIAVLVLSPG